MKYEEMKSTTALTLYFGALNCENAKRGWSKLNNEEITGMGVIVGVISVIGYGLFRFFNSY